MNSTVSHLQNVFGTESPVALITGGGRPGRLGNAIAQFLLERGYQICLHANRSFAAAKDAVGRWEEQGHSAVALPGDLTVESDVDALVENCYGAMQRIDCLVCTAGTWVPQPLETTSSDLVREQFDGNVLSSFLCGQRVGLKMVDQPTGGGIVILGDWAWQHPYRNFAAYHTSKGALDTLTKTLAVELAERNPAIRVNAVHPGPMTAGSDLSPERRAQVIGTTLRQSEGTPQHIAQAVTMLLENDYITGVSLPVDGGRALFRESTFYAEP